MLPQQSSHVVCISSCTLAQFARLHPERCLRTSLRACWTLKMTLKLRRLWILPANRGRSVGGSGGKRSERQRKRSGEPCHLQRCHRPLGGLRRARCQLCHFTLLSAATKAQHWRRLPRPLQSCKPALFRRMARSNLAEESKQCVWFFVTC